jgi:hypothetical protein
MLQRLKLQTNMWGTFETDIIMRPIYARHLVITTCLQLKYHTLERGKSDKETGSAYHVPGTRLSSIGHLLASDLMISANTSYAR